jgi:hypothetical protein
MNNSFSLNAETLLRFNDYSKDSPIDVMLDSLSLQEELRRKQSKAVATEKRLR